MKKTNFRDSSTFSEIRRQKKEALQNIRQEKELMQIYTSALLNPFQQKDKLAPKTPMKFLFNSISTANYTFRLIKSVFSIFKLLH